jgi:hypothetical protein
MAVQPYPERITARGSGKPHTVMNVYLDRLDKYVEQTLLAEHNRGIRRESPTRTTVHWRSASDNCKVKDSKRKPRSCVKGGEAYPPKTRTIRTTEASAT